MLGYNAAVNAIASMEGDQNTKKLMEGVKCRGNENSIAECYHAGWLNTGNTCTYKDFVGVVCNKDKGKAAVFYYFL